MLAVAVVLLVVVVVATGIGLHAGPHGLLASGAVGVAGAAALLAAFLVAAPAEAGAAAVSLAGAVAAVGAGSLTLAWRGLAGREPPAERESRPVLGTAGVAVTDLAPEGVVRIRGESWSAAAVSGPVPAGTPVRVADVDGLRLLVWADDGLLGSPGTIGKAGAP